MRLELDGLRSGPGGFLRPCIQVWVDGSSWKIRHSIWELEASDLFLQRHPRFKDFLERHRPVSDLDSENPEMEKMVRFLVGQGCLTYDGTRHQYSPGEVKYLVRALSSQWYGIYYSHPFWRKLRECQLSLSQVFAWALRTYHLSRSAGPTAARGAVYAPAPEVRAAFLRSAVEEYSHCECYYRPVHPTFGLDHRWVQNLIPFPSSTAFDHQMCVMAEDDWLAHTIVAFFQEYTARFRDNAIALYDRLESRYGLPGFFSGWKEHIGYDLDQTHCDNFEDLFEQCVEELSPEQVHGSIQAARITIQYLVTSLDELLNVESGAELRHLRTSPFLAPGGARQSSLFGGIRDMDETCESSYVGACELVARIVTKAVGEDRLLGNFISQILSRMLHELLVRCLSRCADQEYAVLLGQLLEESQKESESIDVGPYCLASRCALTNFLREYSIRPAEFVFLLFLACRIAKRMQSLSNSTAARLERIQNVIEQRLKLVEMSGDLNNRFLTVGLQFAELCHAAAHWVEAVPNQDVLVSAKPVAIQVATR